MSMTEATLYGGVQTRRVTVRDLLLAKQRGERWPMLTSYDMLTAGLFDEVGVRFAHEVHPSEIAYDYWTTVRAMEAIGHRPAFGLNWDPSHFVWQDLDPVGFLWDFQDRIYHVD